MLEAALAAGICGVGVDVIQAGTIPTPAAAYYAKAYKMAAAMVSASHNPFEDNGIKFFDNSGFKLDDDAEKEIERIYNEAARPPAPVGDKIGRVLPPEEDVERAYIQYLTATLDGDLKGLKIALDCANGATYKAAPAVFERLGADVSVINNTPNGVNINDNCGSTHMEGLVDFVKRGNFDLAFAFDGDGDRCFAVDELGNVVDGDMIMSILACSMKERGRLAKNTVVTTVMSNAGFYKMAAEQDIEAVKVDVGDRYVLKEMLDNGYNLGGEQSGHVIFLDYSSTGDGILTAIKLAEVCKTKGQKFSGLNTKMIALPQVLENAEINNSLTQAVLADENVKAQRAGLEKKYEGAGRVLIRASGTQPLVRITIEGADKEEIQKEALAFKNLLEETAAKLK